MTLKGQFKPTNRAKYAGKHYPIYRSGWERKVMSYLDRHPDVLQWASEATVVPYVSPVDGKRHRYYVDFTVKVKDSEGNIKVELWEVKPLAQTKPPKATKMKGKPTKRYITETVTYAINQAKWDAARKYSEAAGWTFRVITEREIF